MSYYNQKRVDTLIDLSSKRACEIVSSLNLTPKARYKTEQLLQSDALDSVFMEFSKEDKDKYFREYLIAKDICTKGYYEVPASNFRKALLHLHKVHTHRKYVRKYCNMIGMYWQGLVHDLSKYSITEFKESVIYYTGVDSPINTCKRFNGISLAWMHHKGRNKHHYEYWQDNFDFGGTPLQMPFKYACELVCDYIAAGRAYHGNNFTYESEYQWWLNKCKSGISMHPQTKYFIDSVLKLLTNDEVSEATVFNKDSLYSLYLLAEKNTSESPGD